MLPSASVEAAVLGDLTAMQTMVTYALGTAAGDLVAKHFGLGYLATGILLGMIVAALAIGYYVLGLDAMLGFWLAYFFTLPLGPPFGDLLSQPGEYGGLGFGTIITGALFLGAIAVIVVYMTVTRDWDDAAV